MKASEPHIDPLAARVGDFLAARRLVSAGEAVLVAVSGGPDSTALLAVLRELSAAGRQYRLTVAHLDHALRDESADDARWVGELARRWSLPFITERMDVRAAAKAEGTGIELAARDARYAFLRRAARQAGAKIVAVGHHADDNVETVVHRIVRGTHLRGLAGIAASRPLGPCATLIRPLLQCSRRDIRAYCRRTSLASLTDPSNADTRYTRNFIRHELLPLLRDRLNPRADVAIARLAAAAADAEQLIDTAADDLLARAANRRDDGAAEIDAAALAAALPVVAAAAVRTLLERLDVPLRQIGSERLAQTVALSRAADGAAVSLPGGFEARRRGDFIVLSSANATGAAEIPTAKPVELACPGDTVTPGGARITCEIVPLDRNAFERHRRRLKDVEKDVKKDAKGENVIAVEFLDADRIRLPLTCRPRGGGDSFRPLGSPGRQSVGDFLTNLKLPAAARSSVLCISDAEGLVYLAPLRIAHRVRVTPSTGGVLKIIVTQTSCDRPQ